MMYVHSNQLVQYVPPKWCAHLRKNPEHRILLGQLNTPIHRWRCPGLPPDVDLFIKRDDMTGSVLSGSKVRKLEFIMAEAVSRGCRHVITCGDLQSNFGRAVAVAARQLGLTPHLVLRSKENDPSKIGCSGNVFLDRLMSCNVYLMSPQALTKDHLLPKMDEIAARILRESGELSQIIGVGGSDLLGLYGYLSAFQELLEQKVDENFDDIVVAVGSGGTAAGLAIGNYLAKTNLRIHAVSAANDADYFHKQIQWSLDELGIQASSTDLVDIIDGHKGRGYALSTREEIDFLLDVGRSTGIVLDPVYTVKAALGLVDEFRKRPQRFKGKRVLFVHTGGIFSAMDGGLDTTLTRDDAPTNQIVGYDR